MMLRRKIKGCLKKVHFPIQTRESTKVHFLPRMPLPPFESRYAPGAETFTKHWICIRYMLTAQIRTHRTWTLYTANLITQNLMQNQIIIFNAILCIIQFIKFTYFTQILLLNVVKR